MAAAAQQLRDRIAFEPNVPVEVSLDRDGNPTETTARDGSREYRYFLGNHQIMWVPEPVHQAIQRADAGEHAQFAITKHRAPKPWTVIHLDAQEPAAPPPAAHRPAARQTTDDRAAAAIATAETERALTEARQSATAPANLGIGIPMYTALCAAIRTAAAAETFAAQIGRPVAFETGDIRAMAATLFIHQTGGGRQ
jgi:hypothetical protein